MVIKFVSDLRQVGGYLRVLRFPPPTNKTDRHDKTKPNQALCTDRKMKEKKSMFIIHKRAY
jgi:hypothetical protein